MLAWRFEDTGIARACALVQMDDRITRMGSSIDTIDRAIGNKLRGIRAERRLSQPELARLSGVSESTIYRIETGERSAKVAQLDDICKALGIEMYELIKAAMDSLRPT